MKRTTRFLTFFLAGFLLFGCAAREDEPPVPGVKIPSDPQLCFTGEVEIEPAKLARFEKEIEGREARLFADPAELTDGEIGAIAERFGFSADQRTEAGPDRSVYKDPQKKTEIRIDRLGIYTYICDAGNGAPEPPYERSDEESASLARRFLKDHGVPASGFSKWTVEVRAFHTVEGKTEVTEKSVAFCHALFFVIWIISRFLLFLKHKCGNRIIGTLFNCAKHGRPTGHGQSFIRPPEETEEKFWQSSNLCSRSVS